MRRFASAAAAAWLGLVVPACSGTTVEEGSATAVPVDAELLARGRRLYASNCANCHGPGGKGDGASAGLLDPKPRDHTDSRIMEQLSDRHIARVIREGGAFAGYPIMPANPHIEERGLTALVAFVRTLHRGRVDAVDLAGYPGGAAGAR